MSKLYDPIGILNQYLNLYSDLFYTSLRWINAPGFVNIRKDEVDRIRQLQELVEGDVYFVNKGILSLSFVNSLLYRLEESLDLVKNHPGG